MLTHFSDSLIFAVDDVVYGRWNGADPWTEVVVDLSLNDGPVTFLLDKGRTGAPVLDDDGSIVGILTETDCLRLFTGALDERVTIRMTVQSETMPGHELRSAMIRFEPDGLVFKAPAFLECDARSGSADDDRRHLVGADRAGVARVHAAGARAVHVPSAPAPHRHAGSDGLVLSDLSRRGAP